MGRQMDQYILTQDRQTDKPMDTEDRLRAVLSLDTNKQNRKMHGYAHVA